LQNSAYSNDTPYTHEILGEESQGMIVYMLQQALNNNLQQREISVLLTQVEVYANEPAFLNPNKYIGPIFDESQASALQA
ncbi:carbamate kinase, partial [Salmonella enterica]